jgi:hypothetical protein
MPFSIASSMGIRLKLDIVLAIMYGCVGRLMVTSFSAKQATHMPFYSSASTRVSLLAAERMV